MKRIAFVTVVYLSLFVLASCSERTLPPPERPTINDDDVSPEKSDLAENVICEHNRENRPPTGMTITRPFQSPFMLTSYSQSADTLEKGGSEGNEKKALGISHLCIRVAGCDVNEDAPARNDEKFNNPPALYVIVKKGDVVEMTSESEKGWSVEFSKSAKYEFIVEQSDAVEYFFEVWDNQVFRNRCVAIIGPITGREIVRRILLENPNDTREINLSVDESKVRLTIACVGVARWYRLANVNIKQGSPSRKRFADNEPKLVIKLYRNGEVLRSLSGNVASDRLSRGAWEGNYPRTDRNCWPILERSISRYDIEVWDEHYRNKLIFRISDLRGEDFQSDIFEKCHITKKDRLGRVRFEARDGPLTGT